MTLATLLGYISFRIALILPSEYSFYYIQKLVVKPRPTTRVYAKESMHIPMGMVRHSNPSPPVSITCGACQWA